MSPTIKAIKAHVCSTTNPMALPKKLTMAQAALPTIAGSALAAFPPRLLSASPSLCNHFLKPPHLLMEDLLPPANSKNTCDGKDNC